MRRELSKTPDFPPLSKQAIKGLTELLFQKNQLPAQTADLLFVFGVTTSIQEAIEHVGMLVQARIARKIVFTGGVSPYSDLVKETTAEATRLYEALKATFPHDVEVVLETASENTIDNVRLALAICHEPIKSLVFVTRNFHATRAQLTLRYFLGNRVQLFNSSFTPIYKGVKLEADSWHQHLECASRVWGEYLRIKHYSQRGDFDASSLQHLITAIDNAM